MAATRRILPIVSLVSTVALQGIGFVAAAQFAPIGCERFFHATVAAAGAIFLKLPAVWVIANGCFPLLASDSFDPTAAAIAVLLLLAVFLPTLWTQILSIQLRQPPILRSQEFWSRKSFTSFMISDQVLAICYFGLHHVFQILYLSAMKSAPWLTSSHGCDPFTILMCGYILNRSGVAPWTNQQSCMHFYHPNPWHALKRRFVRSCLGRAYSSQIAFHFLVRRQFKSFNQENKSCMSTHNGDTM